MVEGRDGHIDAIRAQLGNQSQLSTAVLTEIPHAAWRRVVLPRSAGQPLEGAAGEGDPGSYQPAADFSTNRTMTVGNISQRSAELVTQPAAMAAAGMELGHIDVSSNVCGILNVILTRQFPHCKFPIRPTGDSSDVSSAKAG